MVLTRKANFHVPGLVSAHPDCRDNRRLVDSGWPLSGVDHRRRVQAAALVGLVRAARGYGAAELEAVCRRLADVQSGDVHLRLRYSGAAAEPAAQPTP